MKSSHDGQQPPFCQYHQQHQRLLRLFPAQCVEADPNQTNQPVIRTNHTTHYNAYISGAFIERCADSILVQNNTEKETLTGLWLGLFFSQSFLFSHLLQIPSHNITGFIIYRNSFRSSGKIMSQSSNASMGLRPFLRAVLYSRVIP